MPLTCRVMTGRASRPLGGVVCYHAIRRRSVVDGVVGIKLLFFGDFMWNKNTKPQYGEAVLIKSNGVIQNITYIFDESDEEEWFEPYHFKADSDGNDLVVPVDKVESWIYLKDVYMGDNTRSYSDIINENTKLKEILANIRRHAMDMGNDVEIPNSIFDIAMEEARGLGV